MQYPSSSCSIDFEKPSIEAKNGKKLGNKIGFTKVYQIKLNFAVVNQPKTL